MRAGDIIIVRGRRWTSRLIRWATRAKGEAPTRATHVGIAVSGTHVVEALWRGVVIRSRRSGQVYRQVNLTHADIQAIVDYARARVGDEYGYWDITMQALDAVPPRRGKFLFRRLCLSHREHSCSRLLAEAWLRAGYTFGVDARAATPDDVEDYLKDHPEKFRQILDGE